jgi:uncharacterized membrane protein YdbT with pleckstrin-like domain
MDAANKEEKKPPEDDNNSLLSKEEKELMAECKAQKRQLKHGAWFAIGMGGILILEFIALILFNAKWQALISKTTDVVVNGVPKNLNPYVVIIVLIFLFLMLLIALGISQLHHLSTINKLVKIVDKLNPPATASAPPKSDKQSQQ